jgi:hypothetical protein
MKYFDIEKELYFPIAKMNIFSGYNMMFYDMYTFQDGYTKITSICVTLLNFFLVRTS